MLKNNEEWYSKAAAYWEKVSPTPNGMLGGYGWLSNIDVQGSLDFISNLVGDGTSQVKPVVACDCGAGIGRVSKHFLCPIFSKVDLVEQNPSFLKKAQEEFLKKEIDEGIIGNLYAMGLQLFIPEKKRYSVIWCQWVLSHLTDDDLLCFFTRCKEGLVENGIIFVKENVSTFSVEVDQEDNSATRTDEDFKKIFCKAGLSLVKEDIQQKFPKSLFRVKMYALRPQQI